MSKRTRQYAGLASAVLAYYILHEGAHLVYALWAGAFRQINFLGLGVQIDVYADRMTAAQLGWFCLAGPAATTAAAYVLTALTGVIGRSSSKLFKACMYYVTIAMLLLDPLYLSLLCGFFGGGDMNGIALLVPELAARVVSGVMLVIHGGLFLKVVLPGYKRAFEEPATGMKRGGDSCRTRQERGEKP